MARLPYVEKAEVGAAALATYEDLEKRVGRVLNPVKMVAHSPELLRDWWKMMITLLTALKLDAKLREIVLMRIFQLVKCDYCFAEHLNLATQTGVTKEQLDHLPEFASHPAFSAIERLALRYAESITLRNEVDDAVFNELRQRLSDQEMVELTFCIGNWNGIARFIVPMGLELESPGKA